MKKTSIEKANEEAKKALKAFEKAVEDYQQRAKRYIYMDPIVLGEPMPRPEELLDFSAFRKIDMAWTKLAQVDGRLRQAYIQLAIAHYAHFIRGENNKQD